MSTCYYWKGNLIPSLEGKPRFRSDKSKVEKIDQNCTRCYFCDESTIGFGKITSTGEVYDNCFESSQKVYKKTQEKKQKQQEEEDNYKNLLKQIVSLLEKTSSFVSSYSEIKNEIAKTKNLIEKGYVINEDNRKGGSKRHRRYKKDNRRFLTDMEIKRLVECLKELKDTFSYQEKCLTLDKRILDIFTEYKKINKSKGRTYDLKNESAEFYNLIKEIEELMGSLELKINRIFPKKENQNEETFTLLKNEALQVISEEEEYLEKTKVKTTREVTRLAKYYIDDKGNRVELDSSVKQRVIHQ